MEYLPLFVAVFGICRDIGDIVRNNQKDMGYFSVKFLDYGILVTYTCLIADGIPYLASINFEKNHLFLPKL